MTVIFFFSFEHICVLEWNEQQKLVSLDVSGVCDCNPVYQGSPIERKVKNESEKNYIIHYCQRNIICWLDRLHLEEAFFYNIEIYKIINNTQYYAFFLVPKEKLWQLF